MDTKALCFSLLLCTATLGQSTPVTTADPNCTARCTLYNKIATNYVDQIDSVNDFGCATEQANQCRKCMGYNTTNAEINLCTKQCEQHSSCQQHCDCSSSASNTTLSSAAINISMERGQEVKLLCRDAKRIGGAVLVVALPYQSHLTRAQYRQQGSPQWMHLEHTTSTRWMKLENLTYGVQYEVQLFSNNSTLPAAVGLFETLEKKYIPLSVREVFMSNYVSGANGMLYANVSWKPAVDRVCCYTIYKGVYRIDTCEPEKHWLALHSVVRGRREVFMVGAITSAEKGSSLDSMSVSVPLCPENINGPDGRPTTPSTKNCSTELPGRVCSIESPGTQNQTIALEVTWEAAKHSAIAPPIAAYRLKLFKRDGEVIKETTVEAVPNKLSYLWKAQVSGLQIFYGYNVQIISESSLGLSEPKVFRRLRIGSFFLSSDDKCLDSASWEQLMQHPVLETKIDTVATAEEDGDDKVLVPHHQSVPVVTAGAGVVVLSVCFLVVAYMSNKKRLSIKRRREEKSFDQFSELVIKSQMIESNEKLVSAPELLRIGHKIGEGHFGIVYKAEMWKPDQKKWIVIAAKTLKGRYDEGARTQFQQECALMREVGLHPHVIGLLGEGSLPHDGGLYMAVEFCERGDLLTLLRSHYLDDRAYANGEQLHQKLTVDETTIVCNSGYGKIIDGKSPLTIIDLMSFARQVALGMEYLSSIRIVHRDLAARNVLVTADLKLKIADFGLSRDVYEGSIYFRQRGPAKLPLRWMALEAIERSMHTSASDVWSFGVLLWEIWTLGKEPYAGLTGMQVLDALKQGQRLHKPNECPHQLYEVMLQCWSESPLSRPTFGSFRALVETMIEGNSYLAISEADTSSSQAKEDVPLLSSDLVSTE